MVPQHGTARRQPLLKNESGARAEHSLPDSLARKAPSATRMVQPHGTARPSREQLVGRRERSESCTHVTARDAPSVAHMVLPCGAARGVESLATAAHDLSVSLASKAPSAAGQAWRGRTAPPRPTVSGAAELPSPPPSLCWGGGAQPLLAGGALRESAERERHTMCLSCSLATLWRRHIRRGRTAPPLPAPAGTVTGREARAARNVADSPARNALAADTWCVRVARPSSAAPGGREQGESCAVRTTFPPCSLARRRRRPIWRSRHRRLGTTLPAPALTWQERSESDTRRVRLARWRRARVRAAARGRRSGCPCHLV
jgi:hypothetical protein